MAGIENKRFNYVEEATKWLKKSTVGEDFNKKFEKHEWKNGKNPLDKINKEKGKETEGQIALTRKELVNLRQAIEKNVIPKNINWYKESQTVIASYKLGTYRWARLRITKSGNNANIDMHIFNSWPGSINIKKSFPMSQVDKIPDFIQKTLQSGVQLKTLFGIDVRSPYTPNENLLEKINIKTKAAVKVFTQNVDK